jgi:hypothetical protein
MWAPHLELRSIDLDVMCTTSKRASPASCYALCWHNHADISYMISVAMGPHPLVCDKECTNMQWSLQGV